MTMICQHPKATSKGQQKRYDVQCPICRRVKTIRNGVKD